MKPHRFHIYGVNCTGGERCYTYLSGSKSTVIAEMSRVGHTAARMEEAIIMSG